MTSGKAMVLCGLAAVVGPCWADQEDVPTAESREMSRLAVPFEAPRRRVECKFARGGRPEDPAPVFELMKAGAQQAVACVAFLEENRPGWHRAAGTDELVAPFVSYLLGDGTARGLQRHQIFIDLLGHLELIAPDWRLRDSVEPLLPRIILGSVVEDPFVADFWATALPEIDQQWRASDAAKSVLPRLYQLAIEEETAPGAAKNDRPRALLKELSWPRYAQLTLVTRVFDSWPRRALGILVALLLVLAAGWLLRRRRTA